METETGWKSKKAAKQYKKMIDFIVPGRKEILTTISRLAAEFGGKAPLILDLGCGHGDVTAGILALKPEARCVLTDFSEEMISLCRERFGGNPNISFYRSDLNNGLPEAVTEMKFDAVVSCFALHHIDFDKRVPLYSAIRAVLNDGSLFINGDMFKGESPLLGGWEFDNWIDWMAVKLKENMNLELTFDEIKKKQLDNFNRMGDKPGTLWEMYNDMKTAGFASADCMFKIQNLAVVAAHKNDLQ